MHVEQVMTKDVKSCCAEDTLNEAARIMWDQDCGCVPVVDADGVVVGVLTDRDICMAAYTRGAGLSLLKVGDAMAKQVVSCGPSDPIEAAEALMQRHQIRRLPVVGFEGRLVGVLSLNDLARAAAPGKVRERALSPAAVEETLAAICQPRVRHAAAA